MVTRDSDRTREAVLEAAERLFARDGYDDCSMQEIGELAGYGRSTPGYLFGSKAALYGAVLDRAVERAATAVFPAFDVAADGRPIEESLSLIVNAFVDFLATDPGYVPLIQREALRAKPELERVMPADRVQVAVDALGRIPGVEDPRRLLMELFALCWFPFSHKRTLMAALGIDSHSEAFLADHKRRVVQLFTRCVPAGSTDHPTNEQVVE